MRVAVFGATGVLGRQVVARLVERRHQVAAVARSPEAAGQLGRIGAEPRLADILRPETIGPVIEGCDAVAHLATAIPPPGPARNWELNDQVRRDGTANLVREARRLGVRRYLQQSIAHLAAGYGESWVDEATQLRPNRVTQSAADMEETVGRSGLDWCILRGGIFYGDASGWDERLRRQARAGALAYPANAEQYVSLIRVADMARAVVAALEAQLREGTLLITDDEPVRYRALFDYICALEGAPAPSAASAEVLPSCRASNARARRELGWVPLYSTYRSGLA